MPIYSPLPHAFFSSFQLSSLFCLAWTHFYVFATVNTHNILFLSSEVNHMHKIYTSHFTHKSDMTSFQPLHGISFPYRWRIVKLLNQLYICTNTFLNQLLSHAIVDHLWYLTEFIIWNFKFHHPEFVQLKPRYVIARGLEGALIQWPHGFVQRPTLYN